MVRISKRWGWIVVVAVVCAVSACSSLSIIDAYVIQGNAKLDLNLYQEAIADYDQALRLQPDNADVYSHRGHAKFNLNQYQAAIADYDQAIRL